MAVMRVNSVLILVVLLGLAACSNRAMYENMLIHQRNECLKEPPPRHAECLEQTNQPYEEYQRKREEVRGAKR